MTKKPKDASTRVKQIKFTMIIGFSVIIVALTVFISALTMYKTDTVLKAKVGDLTTELTVLLKMNMDRYLDTVETTAALVFAYEDIYKYDATDSGLDDYDALSKEADITKKLFDICVMQNFVDFGIVYSNNHTVGRISSGSEQLFGAELYKCAQAMIGNPKIQNGWFSGYNGDFKRIYYVKRLNKHAILLTSLYTLELENVFDHPNNVSDITVRLTNADYVTMYSSSSTDVIGSALPKELRQRITADGSVTVMDEDYLITVNQTDNDWYIICSTKTQAILREKEEMQFYIIIVGIIAGVTAITLGVAFALRLNGRVADTVHALDKKAQIDLLTGIFNKKSFEELTERALSEMKPGNRYALILIDVDNFKHVNDDFGHAYGDKILAQIGKILRKTFREQKDIIGRIGGDEFCVLLKTNNTRHDTFMFHIEERCLRLRDYFHEDVTFQPPDGSARISVSIGVTPVEKTGQHFEDLYRKSDGALYASKHKGKDTYVICNADEDNHTTGGTT